MKPLVVVQRAGRSFSVRRPTLAILAVGATVAGLQVRHESLLLALFAMTGYGLAADGFYNLLLFLLFSTVVL